MKTYTPTPSDIDRQWWVVDAEGKREASFAPMIDATLKGPEGMSQDWPPC